MKLIFSLFAGLVFGIGIAVSGMMDPAKVLNFFDVAGSWDPSLAFVMAGAVLVFSIGYRLALRRSAPLFASGFSTPAKRELDKALISGSLLFGAGWGLAGLCPCPAVVSSGFGEPRVWAFVAAMVSAMVLVRLVRQRATC